MAAIVLNYIQKILSYFWPTIKHFTILYKQFDPDSEVEQRNPLFGVWNIQMYWYWDSLWSESSFPGADSHNNIYNSLMSPLNRFPTLLLWPCWLQGVLKKFSCVWNICIMELYCGTPWGIDGVTIVEWGQCRRRRRGRRGGGDSFSWPVTNQWHQSLQSEAVQARPWPPPGHSSPLIKQHCQGIPDVLAGHWPGLIQPMFMRKFSLSIKLSGVMQAVSPAREFSIYRSCQLSSLVGITQRGLSV